jgi:large subunit ribosomal protein L6
MSRIGRQPIPVPAGVQIAIEPELVTVNGPKGELHERVHRDIKIERVDEQIIVTRPTDRGEHRALHGLTRTLVANMVEGVTAGFEKRLEIQGVGYRAALRGRDL